MGSITPDVLDDTKNGHKIPYRTLKQRLIDADFRAWYKQREYRQNIENGQHYFNGSADRPEPERHSPSKLMQCHRKIHYKRANAPEEDTSPKGVFWFGTKFEEDLVTEFLRDIAGDNVFVQNSVWIDTELTHNNETLHIRGVTDPVVVNDDAEPVFVTEIKSTSHIEERSAASVKHKAQLHAYMYALNEEYDHDITDGVILYGDRNTFKSKTFRVEFDADFWGDVLDWMATQTRFERRNELPPADPQHDWECNWCSFKERCGEGSSSFRNEPVKGLLPLFEYPREKVVSYVDAHDDAVLTPTVAGLYPGLAESVPVGDWRCRSCGEEYAWDSENVERGGDVSNPPSCPQCLTGVLSGVAPQQHTERSVGNK